MFGMFRSKADRAAEAVSTFLHEKFAVSGLLPTSALSDRYCLGFLQMVSMHVASQSLPKGSGMDATRDVFVQALAQLAPRGVRDAVAESLPLIRNDETFLSGTKDGDLYMGWMLLYLAPERDGQAALRRFADRVREIISPPKTQPNTDRSSPPGGSREGSGSGGSVQWTDWKAEDRTEGFDGPAKQDISRTYTFSGIRAPQSAATLTIVCALEATATPDGEAVSLDRKLRFHLRPFRLPREADFIMRLATRDEVQGGEFDIVAAPEGDNGALIAKYGGRNDVATCVATLRSGRDVVFMLRDEQESLVNFLLPNDDEFQRLYDGTLEKLQQRAVMNQVLRHNAELQRGQRARPLAPPASPTPSLPDFDGFEIGEALFFPPLHNMGRIVDFEEFEGVDGPTHRFVIEFDDDETEMRVPVSRLRDLMSRKRKTHTDEELEDVGNEDDEELVDPVRPITESNEFKANEFVVYPAHGVGQILAIEEQEIAGAKLELLVINFMKDKMTLRVPSTTVANVGMRKLSDPALVKKALESLMKKRLLSYSEWAGRAREYEAKINSGDLVAIAEVVRDLYCSESQSEQSYSERQLYEAALDRLSREIAIVLEMTETESVREIETYLTGNTPESRPMRQVRETTDEELNAIIAALLNPLADFKSATGISYTHVVPAIYKISVGLLVRARGLSSVRKSINLKVQELDARGGAPVRSILEVTKPPVAPEDLAELNSILWNFANEALASGRPMEHVAQAYGALAMTVAERAGQGDDWLFRATLAETLREMQSDDYRA